MELFHSLKLQAQLSLQEQPMGPDVFSRMYKSPTKVLKSAIKPSKRFRTDVSTSSPVGSNERIFLASASLDSEFNFVDIPIDELKGLPQEEAFARMLFYWEDLSSNINKFSTMMRRLHEECGHSFDLMDTKVDSVDARLGRCTIPGLSDDCITTWDGVAYLHDMMGTLFSTVNDCKVAISRVNEQIDQEHEANQSSSDQLVSDFSKGLNEIVELIKVLNDEQTNLGHRVTSAGTQTPGLLHNSINQELANIHQKISALESTVMNSTVQSVNAPGNHQAEMMRLKMQMKLLEARLLTHSILKLGGFTFQSRADVAMFVETKMPSNTFSMFHDVITLLERLSGNYVECKDVINEWYQASKVGLDEREARHVASFKITYPTVFGYVKEGSTSAKCHLPAIKSFKDWNSFDAESGVKSFMLNGMEDLKLQLYQDISTVFNLDGLYDARVLANDMHSKSQIFVSEMANWMDVFYQELLTTSEATEEEAWELVSACIKKVFEELRRVHASAANATSDTDPSSRCATYMWALIQSHRVMKDFLDMRFWNHSLIAPVIILHVFKTRLTRTAFTTQFKRLEGRVAKLESTPAFKNPKPSPKDTEDKKGAGKN